jgi:hypothetical protein
MPVVINTGQAAPKGEQSLREYLRDKVYLVIGKFRELCKGEAHANFEQFRRVMIEVTSQLN